MQKSAKHPKNDPIPREVLNPEHTAEQYAFRIYPPSSRLVGFVDYYWIMRWDLRNAAPFAAEVIPSPYVNLTFMPEGSRITGVTTGKYTYLMKDVGTIVGIKFKPGGFHTFWQKNVRGLTNAIIPASNVFPQIDTSYNQAMLALPDEVAVQHMEQLLIDCEPALDKNLQTIHSVMSYLETTDGATLAGAAASAGLSERRLQEIFQEYVGVGVKWIVLRTRLIKAAHIAAASPKPDWSAAAQDLGYADQSHFINDFKKVIGQTPTQYSASIHKK